MGARGAWKVVIHGRGAGRGGRPVWWPGRWRRAPPPRTTTAPAAAGAGLVGRLVQAMTLDEKLGMVNGWPDGVSPPPTTDRLIGVGFIPGVPRLGVPALTFTDGPAGVRMNLPTTAMPAPVALAATFSADLAQRYGQVLGRDSRARDQDVIFAPMLNLARVPQAGRNFETLGEDPFLMAGWSRPRPAGSRARA